MMRLLQLAAFCCAAVAQSSDGLIVPVSRTVNLTADEAAFTIGVAGTLDSTEQQVKQALQNAGLPNPTVVATGLGPSSDPYARGPALVLYSATVTIPAGSALDAARRLEALRTRLTDPLRSLQYSFAANPSQATIDAMRQVVLPQMMDEAKKLAQSLAAATGVKVGAVRSISESPSGYFLGVPTAFARFGDFSQINSLPSTTQYTYYLNVVFAAQ